jgi:hypothetical protein
MMKEPVLGLMTLGNRHASSAKKNQILAFFALGKNYYLCT